VSAPTAGAPGPFGPTGATLLQRLRPRRVDVAELREVAEQVLPQLAAPGLVAVVREGAGGAVVVVEEDERALRVHLRDLAEDMTAAGVPGTPQGLGRALRSWVEHRPVSDASAAADGVAVLDWADERHAALGWRVVVRRGPVAVGWTPSEGLPAHEVARARAAAYARSAAVPVELRVEGPVALWSHPVPALSSAVLTEPETAHARVVAAGLPLPQLHAVVTPSRPVACAAPGVAARLAGQSAEDCCTLPWAGLTTLPWV
jgi:hypothetical protein